MLCSLCWGFLWALWIGLGLFTEWERFLSQHERFLGERQASHYCHRHTFLLVSGVWGLGWDLYFWLVYAYYCMSTRHTCFFFFSTLFSVIFLLYHGMMVIGLRACDSDDGLGTRLGLSLVQVSVYSFYPGISVHHQIPCTCYSSGRSLSDFIPCLPNRHDDWAGMHTSLAVVCVHGGGSGDLISGWHNMSAEHGFLCLCLGERGPSPTSDGLSFAVDITGWISVNAAMITL